MRQMVFLFSVLIFIQYFSIQSAEVTDELDNELLLKEFVARKVKRSGFDVDGYVRYPKKDYYGFDIQKFEDIDRAGCAEECNVLIECKGFVFNTQDETCYVKNKAKLNGIPFMNNAHGELFIKERVEVIGYTFYPQKDYYGKDIRKLRNSNPFDCADECDDEPKCKGIVFNIYNKFCYLKHEAKPEGKHFVNAQAGELYIKDTIHNVEGFNRYEGRDYCGKSIDTITDTDREFCGNLCIFTPACKGFVFVTGEKKCCLKSEAKLHGELFSINAQTDLFIKN